MAKAKSKGTLELKNQRRCDTCGEPLVYNGKGRPPRFCSTCKSITETKPSSIKPIGVPVTPPDIPQDTILKGGAPKLMEVSAAPDPWGTVSAMAASLDANNEIENVERRISLISRYIIEAALWDAQGLSKKERFDMAISSIKTVDGVKSNLWVKDETNKNIPHTQAQFFKEKTDTEERLRRLLKEKDRIDDPEIKATAQQLAAAENGAIEMGEA